MNKTNNYDAILIGAGPAGSSAATILSEKGHNVLLVEREKFPRYHVGESLLPFTFEPLKRLGLIDDMRNSSFTKKHSQTHTNFCKVEYADWFFLDTQLVFEIRADRFLWNMVRSIVGTLLQVGEKKIRPSFVNDILAKKDRSLAGKTVPAHALFLHKIEYSNKIINVQK